MDCQRGKDGTLEALRWSQHGERGQLCLETQLSSQKSGLGSPAVRVSLAEEDSSCLEALVGQ